MKKRNIVLIIALGIAIISILTYMAYQNGKLKEQITQQQLQNETSTSTQQQPANVVTEPTEPKEEPIVQPKLKSKTEQELREELLIQESWHPLNYLSLSNVQVSKVETRKKNIFHGPSYSNNDVDIKGTINNAAKFCRYIDIVITVSSFSQTGTLINSQDFTVYQAVLPNTKITFTKRITLPDGTASYQPDIKGATAYNR
jgi:hypothetical protein